MKSRGGEQQGLVVLYSSLVPGPYSTAFLIRGKFGLGLVEQANDAERRASSICSFPALRGRVSVKSLPLSEPVCKRGWCGRLTHPAP
jgi:hypothetical protein